jgi:hypothetical protein
LLPASGHYELQLRFSLRKRIKTKITAGAVTLSDKIKNRSGRLDQCANALGAQYLFDFATILDNRHLLKIRVEGAVGDTMRERDVMAEGSGLTTMSTFCHFLTSFPANNTLPVFYERRILPRNASLYKSSVIIEYRGQNHG